VTTHPRITVVREEARDLPSPGVIATGPLTSDALAAALRARGWMLAAAESCTGGMIAAECTSLAGSSDWFERGFVTYSNEAKTEMLGVAPSLIASHGAVSAEVAQAMTAGALAHSKAQVAVAVTGIAGPRGATPGKPVGTVWLAVARRGCAPVATLLKLDGDRAAIRAQTVREALNALIATLAQP
jgi:nicotinamide-nucleotide amidase